VEIVRWPVLASLFLLVTPLPMLLPWLAHARRAAPAGFWWLKAALLLCAIALLLPVLVFSTTTPREWGTIGPVTMTFYAGTVLLPIAVLLALALTIAAWRRGAGRWFRAYALVVVLAGLIVSGYLASWGLIGFRPWDY
jgi:hypothetical protein